MLKQWGLAAIISVMASVPAWAQSNSCGGEPIAPAIPTAAEMGEKSPADALKLKHQTFLDINKEWKTSLKDYDDCLDAALDTDKRQLQDAKSNAKPDQDKIKKLEADITNTGKAVDHAAQTDEGVVNDWNALSTAFCARADVDKATCPKT